MTHYDRWWLRVWMLVAITLPAACGGITVDEAAPSGQSDAGEPLVDRDSAGRGARADGALVDGDSADGGALADDGLVDGDSVDSGGLADGALVDGDSADGGARADGESAAGTPTLARFEAASPIASHEFNYPAVVGRAGRPDQWLMFSSGFAHHATTTMLATTPVGNASHVVYPSAQEEIWVSRYSSDLERWPSPEYSFGIRSDTPVASHNDQPYATVYPNGFKPGCGAFQAGQCNVQIADASVVRLQDAGGEHYYLYFTIFENYRWYDGSLGGISDLGPSKPASQNLQAIGLAVGDDGVNWAFIGKVIAEDPPDADLGGGQTEKVLGAWAPGAVAIDDQTVDIYFHDALGTKQYVARLDGGVSIRSIKRLNRHDTRYRVNLDVLQRDGRLEAVYNDSSFNIERQVFSGPADFGQGGYPPQPIVPAVDDTVWPTPHQVLGPDGVVHLFFYGAPQPVFIHHWRWTPGTPGG